MKPALANDLDDSFLSIEDFTEQTGMIEDVDVILELIDNADLDIDIKTLLKEDLDECGHFNAYSGSLIALNQLLDVIGRESYHIVTSTDSDDGNDMCFDNCVRYVNRINYYLANGNADPDLYSVEQFSRDE